MYDAVISRRILFHGKNMIRPANGISYLGLLGFLVWRGRASKKNLKSQLKLFMNTAFWRQSYESADSESKVLRIELRRYELLSV